MNYILLLTLLLAGITVAQTNYVALDGGHVPPFTNWLTAATNIQAAVDVAQDGDLVLVMTGEYNCGGRPAPGQLLTNRLVVTKPITVQSVFGPQQTIIAGAPDPALTNGPQAVRGAYLANCAILSGFTITRGCTSTTTTNDNVGGGVFLADGACLRHCHVVSNSAVAGGGLYALRAARVEDSISAYNRAREVCGVCALSNATIVRCVIVSNSSSASMGWPSQGVGAYVGVASTMMSCRILHTMSASFFTSAVYADLKSHVDNCDIHHNLIDQIYSGLHHYAVELYSASMFRSRIYNNGVSLFTITSFNAKIYDCEIYQNKGAGIILNHFNDVVEGCHLYSNGYYSIRAIEQTAIVRDCLIHHDAPAQLPVAYNCTLYANRSDVDGRRLYNCIISNNTSTSYWYTTYVNCCLQITNGIGTITGDPLFRDAANGDFRLRRDSPCINAGTNMADMGTWDVAGQPRVHGYRVDIGAYEFATTGACIAVTERIIDFGHILVGDTATSAVRVVNLGDEPVVGMATNVVTPFAILAGAEYIVQSEAYHDVTLAFTPPAEGTYSNTVMLLGGGDEAVMVRGTGVPEPAMALFIFLLWLAQYNLATRQV